MNENKGKSGSEDIAGSLEQKLSQAKKEKQLSQSPAFRRLHLVIRGFFVFGILGALFSLTIGVTVHLTQAALSQNGANFLSWVSFVIWITILCGATILGWLTIYSYLRFIRQFRRYEVTLIGGTMEVISRLWKFQLWFVLIVPMLFTFLMFQTVAAVLEAAVVSGLLALVQIVFYFTMQHYLKTALAELPSFRNTLGDGGTSAYWPWKKVYLFLLVPGIVTMAGGYIFAEVQNPLPKYTPAISLEPTVSSDPSSEVSASPKREWVGKSRSYQVKLPETWGELSMPNLGMDLLIQDPTGKAAWGMMIENAVSASGMTSEKLAGAIPGVLTANGATDVKSVAVKSVSINGRVWVRAKTELSERGSRMTYLYSVHYGKNATYTAMVWSSPDDFEHFLPVMLETLNSIRLAVSE